MKTIIYILVSNTIIFLSCGSKEINDSYDNKKKSIVNNNVIQNKVTQNDSLNKKLIIYDEFIRRVIENDLTLQNIKKVYQTNVIHEELIQNKHNTNIKDTLIIFTEGNDSICFYKGWGNTIPQKIVIFSEKLIIDKNIKIGVNKDLFHEKFKMEIIFDTLIMKDIEGGNIFTFIFIDNKLSKIIYQGNYLD